MWAPCSARIRVASRKYLAFRTSCFPTATTPNTGMPYRSPISTVRHRSSRESRSPCAPMKVWTARAEALIRRASSMSRPAPPPALMSSWSTEASWVARRQRALSVSGGTQVRRAPLVAMRTSTKGSRGSMTMSSRSSPEVEPMMYPWSKASMTVLPEEGRKMRESRFFIPQEQEESPFT